MRSLFLLVSFLLVFPFANQADSPLTSTPFHTAYSSIKIVQYASEHPVLDKKIAKYLIKDKNPLHIKAAVINAMGWDFDGKQNAELLLEYLARARGIDGQNKDFSKLNPTDLFCMGYCMAMDNYFEVDDAASILALAGTKMPNNFTVHFIHSLVIAQIAMEVDFCDVWRLVAEVEENKTLERSMMPEAIAIVMDYIGLYKEECHE